MRFELNENYFEEKSKQENNSDLWFICNFGIIDKVMDLYATLKDLNKSIKKTEYEIAIEKEKRYLLRLANEYFIELCDRYELFEDWNLFDSITANCYCLEEFLDDYCDVTILNCKSMLSDLELWLDGLVGEGNSMVVVLQD